MDLEELCDWVEEEEEVEEEEAESASSMLDKTGSL